MVIANVFCSQVGPSPQMFTLVSATFCNFVFRRGLLGAGDSSMRSGTGTSEGMWEADGSCGIEPL